MSVNSPIASLILGTRNLKKCREMEALICPPWEPNPRLSQLQIRSIGEFEGVPDVVEDADSFAGNARKKASEQAIATGHWVLADDSGLAVDELGGEPGVYSARYAGEPSNDLANNRKLLEALQGVPMERRGAAFWCVLALSDPSGQIILEAAGSCRGQIVYEARGDGGFGYDPLFLIREYHRTFGELTPLVKHQLSHRAKAFSNLRAGLDRLIAQGAFKPS
jgi:XTP/dITP diphosphohydrolase